MYGHDQRFAYAVADLVPEAVPADLKKGVSIFYTGMQWFHTRQIIDADGITRYQVILQKGKSFTDLLVNNEFEIVAAKTVAAK